jgi:hypothetical protein
VTTTYYASINTPSSLVEDVDNSGTSSTASDNIEIRIGNGTYAPDRREVIMACNRFIRWVVQGGLDQLGTNIPLPTGSV